MVQTDTARVATYNALFDTLFLMMVILHLLGQPYIYNHGHQPQEHVISKYGKMSIDFRGAGTEPAGTLSFQQEAVLSTTADVAIKRACSSCSCSPQVHNSALALPLLS